MIEKSEMISRRRAFSILGLATLGLAAMPNLLMVSEAEAQTSTTTPPPPRPARSGVKSGARSARDGVKSGVLRGRQGARSGVKRGRARPRRPLQALHSRR